MNFFIQRLTYKNDIEEIYRIRLQKLKSRCYKMCTAVSYSAKRHYFGRTLDLEYSFDEKVTVVPRNFPLKFKYCKTQKSHFAIIGMATVCDGYPLYYDAVNEHGLCIAALNFPISAHFTSCKEGVKNIATFEVIPYILGKYESADMAMREMRTLNITNDPFSSTMLAATLHWIICDKHNCYTVEKTKEGLKIYENDVGVLTNEPSFDFHRKNLSLYMNVSPKSAKNEFSKKIKISPFSKGMGALGLPGDNSSCSRFIRAAFNTLNREFESGEGGVTDFFNIMSSVFVTRGSVVEAEKSVVSLYTSCIDADDGVYYYSSEKNRQICAVAMKREELDSSELICYDLEKGENIKSQN